MCVHIIIFLCTSRNQLISDDAYSFGDRFLNEEKDERIYLIKKETTAVSILYVCVCIYYGRIFIILWPFLFCGRKIPLPTNNFTTYMHDCSYDC